MDMNTLKRLAVLMALLAGCGASEDGMTQSITQNAPDVTSGAMRAAAPTVPVTPERPATAQPGSDAGAPDAIVALPPPPIPDADTTQRDTAPGPAILTITPSEYTFSAIGQMATFTVRNIGGATVPLMGSIVTAKTDYRDTGGDCSGDLAPGASCRVMLMPISASPADGHVMAGSILGAKGGATFGPIPPPVSALLRFQPL